LRVVSLSSSRPPTKKKHALSRGKTRNKNPHLVPAPPLRSEQRKVNFSGSDLTGVSLMSALAQGSNFSGANLTNADLESGNYEDADCESCPFFFYALEPSGRERDAPPCPRPKIRPLIFTARPPPLNALLPTPPTPQQQTRRSINNLIPKPPETYIHQNHRSVTNANLTGAFVTNAQFKRVKIAGSDWTDVVLRRDVQEYLCSIAEGTNPTTGADTRESLVCP